MAKFVTIKSLPDIHPSFHGKRYKIIKKYKDAVVVLAEKKKLVFSLTEIK